MAIIKPVQVKKTIYNTYALHFYTPDNRRRRFSVGKDESNAQRLRIKFQDWLFNGLNPEKELEATRTSNGCPTIKEYFPEFMKQHGNHRSVKTQDSYRNSFKNVCRCSNLSDTELGKISKKIVMDYMRTRIENDNVTNATVNREAALLKVMLSCAHEFDIIQSNPLQGLKLLKEAEKRDVKLTMEQAESLLKELPKPIANIVEFAIYTGFRKQNILGLKIEDITFHDLQQSAHVELIVKGNRKEKFPLGPLAVEILKRAIGDRKCGFIFLNPVTQTRFHSIHKSFNIAVRKLGLTVNGTKFRFHDLRHVYAGWLHQKGVSLDVLRNLMGHRDRKTTDRYVTTDRLELGRLLEVMPRIGKVA